MLKMALAGLTEDRAFALFFRPHPEGFDSSRVLTPGNLRSKAKKMLMPGAQPGGRGGAGRRWMHKRLIKEFLNLRFIISFFP